MFSDHVISVAGRSILLTPHDLFMAAILLLIGAVLLTAFFLSRKRFVVLRKSEAAEQLTYELSRIADALERVANMPADSAIAAGMRLQQHTQPQSQTESKGSSYSVLGLDH